MSGVCWSSEENGRNDASDCSCSCLMVVVMVGCCFFKKIFLGGGQECGLLFFCYFFVGCECGCVAGVENTGDG